MSDQTRIKISQVLEAQIPDFVNDEFPLFKSFLQQYFQSLEFEGGAYNLLQNIDKNINLDFLLSIPESTESTDDFFIGDDVLEVESTKGFPSSYGLLKIDDEIITYTSKTDREFLGCIRGFSGVSQYRDSLIFSETGPQNHPITEVINLSSLLFKEFFRKLKNQITPGFEDRELDQSVGKRAFFKHARDLYTTKGSDRSFKILFGALYGTKVDIIRPSDFVFEPSASQSRRTVDLVLSTFDDTIDYTDLILNRTLFQKERDSTDSEDRISAYAAITKVERFFDKSKYYYRVSLDDDFGRDISASGTIFGKFQTTQTTRLVEDHVQNLDESFDDYIFVDSTVDFDELDNLDVYLDSGVREISYNGKSVNEFYGLENADFTIPRGTLVSTKKYAYVELEDDNVFFRVTNVLSSTIFPEGSDFEENEVIKFDSLGLKNDSVKVNNWKFNVAAKYNLESITLLSKTNRQYSIKLESEFNLFLQDKIFLQTSTDETYNATISSRSSADTYIITSETIIPDFDNTGLEILTKKSYTKKFFIERKLNKGNLKNFPETKQYLSDVQTTYKRRTLKDSCFVMSSSIPNYSNEELPTDFRRIVFSTNISSDAINTIVNVGQDATPTQSEVTHSFYTGDSIVYFEDTDENNTNRLNIKNGRYFVTVVDNKNIRLSTSLTNLYNKVYVNITGNVIDNTFYYVDYFDVQKVLSEENPFRLSSKRLVKKLGIPINDSIKSKTIPGKIGILNNGVEILNYKSKTTLKYGSIVDIDVLSSGDEEYDVINPPELKIFDGDNADGINNGGIGATAHANMVGSVREIFVIDGGFNYIEEPTVRVFGGGGSFCAAKPVMETYRHVVEIDGEDGDQVDISSNLLTVSYGDHLFTPGEEVVYKFFGDSLIGGLEHNTIYYVGVEDSISFKLYKEQSDALNRTNPIELTDFGLGISVIEATQNKKRIVRIDIEGSSNDFKNRKVLYNSEKLPNSVDFYKNEIIIPNHGFGNGDLIIYDSTDTPIAGLSSGQGYHVTVKDFDRFSLSIADTDDNLAVLRNKEKYFAREYVDLFDVGSGDQIFRYPDIGVTIESEENPSLFVQPQLLPIVRGEISDIFLESGGVGYGCTNIFNFNRPPIVTAEPGKLASVKPFIVDGTIQNVIIQNVGQGYVSQPTIRVITNDDSGFGAELIPIVKDGLLVDVIVKNGGFDYTDATTLEVISAGKNAVFNTEIYSWNVNEVERNFSSNQIYDDDGFIYQDSTTSIDVSERYGISQYTLLYVPRKFRETIYTKSTLDGRNIYNPDLVKDNLGKEKDSKYHSPLIGWAYDGNPIYGPYGYVNPDGTGGIKRIVSGYKKATLANRPSLIDYPLGFFTNDFKWTSDGDLDESNGRFCITPEYPNGVYAYFATIGENSARFKNYKEPSFPYFIGDKFKSSPIDFNFDPNINQENFTSFFSDSLDQLSNTDLLRNIIPYNLSSSYGSYPYIFNPESNTNIKPRIKKTSLGTINELEIVSGGENYKPKEKIIFDDQSGERRPLAQVVSVANTSVSQISLATTTITGVELLRDNSTTSKFSYVGYTTTPHNLKNGPLKVYEVERNLSYISDISVRENVLTLNSGIGSTSQTGIVTYISIFGRDLSYFRENDVFSIPFEDLNEQVKILNIDLDQNRLRVERNFGGTIGTSYSAGQKLYENPRIFRVNDARDVGEGFSYEFSEVNRQFYFDPKESVGVGIGTTVNIENPGIGRTSRFIDKERIYIPNNRLKINDVLRYDFDDEAISVDSGVNQFNLERNLRYFVYPFDLHHIGLSTNQIGVGSTGVVGLGTTSTTTLLTFNDFGSGKNHSFKTDSKKVARAEISRFEVTVTTEEDHNLIVTDSVTVNCKPTSEKVVDVVYNDLYNKFSVGTLRFNADDIDTVNDTIRVINHGLSTGQVIIYTSDSPSEELTHNNLYNVIVVDSDTVMLVDTVTEWSNLNTVADLKNLTVHLTTQSAGELRPINPPLTLKKNQTLVFDVSDSTLSYTKNNIKYPAFTLEFYTDKTLTNRFLSTKQPFTFNVINSGKIGVDSDATVKLVCDDYIPEKLYYNLVPLKNDNVPASYSSARLDDEIENSITFEDSSYSGTYKVISKTDKTFKYNIPDFTDEGDIFTQDNANISYGTISTHASGPINTVRIISGGKNLYRIPQVISIESETGKNAVLKAKSNNIGVIKDVNIENIGFDFPTDYTLSPRAHAPTLIRVEELSSIVSIGVTSPGKNYTVLPELIVVDGLTKKVIEDIDLQYLYDTRYKVRILRNVGSINNVLPSIIPINNTNGYKIRSLSYDSNTKDATIVLDTVGFSTLSAWPFTNGSKFLIEGVILKSTDNDEKGFNSENYEYKLFEVKTNDPNIGGQVPSFTFNMEEFVGDGSPGEFDSQFVTGRVISESYFPKFTIETQKNIFLFNEEVSNGVLKDKCLGYDSNTSILKISTNSPYEYEVGQEITGKSSNSKAKITEIVGITTFTYRISPYSRVNKKPFNKKGFLNEDSQRLQDSDYYQYFSYELKSNVGISSWNDPVDSILHPVGMKKFGNLQIESVPVNSEIVGIQTESGFLGINNIVSKYDLNCIHDIDIVTENNIKNVYSDEIRFNSLILQDYLESVGNRVLLVDDISEQFNSNPRSTEFSTVDTFSLDAYRAKKYVLVTADKKFPGERQIIVVNVIHNNIYGFLNQYGRVETDSIHGYFDIGVFENNGLLLFYPIEPRFDDYSISGYQYAFASSNLGISTQYVGDIAAIGIQTTKIPTGTNSAYKIVGINSSYSSSKVILSIEKTDLQYYQYDEFNITHNGNDIVNVEFGKLTTDTFDLDVSEGIGTYQFSYNGDEIEVSLIPNSGLTTDYQVSATVVSISDTSRVSTGTSTYQTVLTTVGFGSTSVGSATTSIQIMEIDPSYTGFSVYASIEDTTNNIVQFSELNVIHDNTEIFLSEYGRIITDDNFEDTGIGTFTAYIDPVSKKSQIYFEPLAIIEPAPNREVEVRLLVNALGPVNLGISTTELNFDKGEFSIVYGNYTGTENDVKRSFELRHQGDLIFERIFDASSIGTVVSTEENVLNLSNHFFVTGEKVTYTYPAGNQPIGIATTTLVGVGTTTHLPTTLYVVKKNSSSISFTDSAENALKFNPEVNITLTSAGIGTQHKITASNQDVKGIFTIDNMMQSPIQETDISTTLDDNISLTDTLINTAGITSIFSGDIIKINDEFMLVETVGVGTLEKIRVRRPWLGSELGVHTAGNTATKMVGNYVILGSTINFTSPPYGKVPITVDVNQFGVPFVDPNDRDFTGITTNSSFHGRTFMRSGSVDTLDETYSKNYLFDDISSRFTGIRSEFPLTVNGANVTGISTDNAIILVNDIFQQPSRSGVNSITGNYTIEENGGETTIVFDPSTINPGEDINTSDLPSGGVIVTIGSTNGLGYQPCVAAGGTATVSGLGSITAISIGNSGSGYRSGIQTHINVKAVTPSSVSIIGYATALNGNITGVAITNPGTAYTTTSLPEIVFDAPIGYTNIPLIYSDSSVQGIGTKASIDMFVSRDTSIAEFKFNNNGYAYGQGEKLTVAIGGTTGIPTDTSKTFNEFQITVERTKSDEFSTWTVGQFQQLDTFDSQFDGVKKVFSLSYQGNRLSIRSKSGSGIDVSSTLLIFINDILQVPGQSYIVRGGGLVVFDEPIPEEYTSRILFYKGTRDVDVVDVDIDEPVEPGDTIKINSDDINKRENFRTAEEILASDIVLTNPYRGPGRTNDESLERPAMLCKQTEDLFLYGVSETKDRKSLEPTINPSTNLIQNVGIGTTINYAWVESVKTFFDNSLENQTSKKLGIIEIISQEVSQSAFASAKVSSAGIITEFSITNPGAGYTQNPQISVSSPGLGNTIAIATCLTTSGIVTDITLINSGSGYTNTKPPQVLIEPPVVRKEIIEKVTYEGDFGTIVSISNTSVGVGTTALLLSLYIPFDSYLRNQNINSGFATGGWSGIETGHYFTCSNSNTVGTYVTSLNNYGETLSISTSRMNVVFQAADIERKYKNVVGIGSTQVLEVTVYVEDEIDLGVSRVGFDNSHITFDSTLYTFDTKSRDLHEFYGNFSWGKITWDALRSRRRPISFDSYHLSGYPGISSSPVVKRVNPLKSDLYTRYQ